MLARALLLIFMVIIRPMLKKFILLLLTVFTLQLSWAVVSVYCLHDADKSTQHFGHHPHQHAAQAEQEPATAHVTDAAEKTAAKTSFHTDCSTCAHTPLGDCASNCVATPAQLASYPLLAALPHSPTPFLAQPERPKWFAWIAA